MENAPSMLDLHPSKVPHFAFLPVTLPTSGQPAQIHETPKPSNHPIPHFRN